ncbi:MAG TPA: dTDP-4-dehydrorhamnose 3,5-epimerase family protein [Vicinamibacterales bacterium]|nr:dTDP-4-dehydrorhamnose 3,5-epimerase family protein [Vicinamibacterales bacterium]
MKILSVASLSLPDIKVIRFGRFADQRGYFTEPFRRSDLDTHPETTFLAGVAFVQANESLSRPGTLRGLHFQWNPYMGKLVRTLHGHMIDIVLDIRLGSPTFGKAILYDMPNDDGRAEAEWIWVPPGFAHGNLFLTETRIEYLCTGEYSPACEAGISPLAADMDWSLCDPTLYREFEALVRRGPIMSDKDRGGFTVAQWRADPRAAYFTYPMPQADA